MSNFVRVAVAGCLALLTSSARLLADNPLILDQFTADPTARVFEGKIYLYPSHDIRATPGKGRPDWFCMEDYHVFSSENLIDWQDHGIVVSQTSVPWTDPNAYAMWAPDCVERAGKYYFFFPAPAKPQPTTSPATGPSARRRGSSGIGVAIADKPSGPFTPQPTPIAGIGGIDPCVLIDKDGQAYIYTAAGRISVAKLKDNMVELGSKPQVIQNLPTQGLIEGPFAFERNGIYYLTFPHVANKTERLEYAMGKSPLGPFTMTGVIMDESPSGCWTNHHSLVEYKGQWYLFYHDKDLSPDFDKNRSVRADYLTFNADGTINKVVPTLRGVGIKGAGEKIQIDRFSDASKESVAVDFLNKENPHLGWKVTLSNAGSWVRYDRVDFGNGGCMSAAVQAISSTGGTIEIRLDKPDAPPVARVEIGKSGDWSAATAKLLGEIQGVHDLIVTQSGPGSMDIDWVQFQ